MLYRLKVVFVDNEEIVYNKKENILNPYFIASGLTINE